MLKSLQRSFPHCEDDRGRRVHSWLGEENQRRVAEAVKAVRAGDAERLGALMTAAQKDFDDKAFPSARLNSRRRRCTPCWGTRRWRSCAGAAGHRLRRRGLRAARLSGCGGARQRVRRTCGVRAREWCCGVDVGGSRSCCGVSHRVLRSRGGAVCAKNKPGPRSADYWCCGVDVEGAS